MAPRPPRPPPGAPTRRFVPYGSGGTTARWRIPSWSRLRRCGEWSPICWQTRPVLFARLTAIVSSFFALQRSSTRVVADVLTTSWLLTFDRDGPKNGSTNAKDKARCCIHERRRGDSPDGSCQLEAV